MTLQWAKDLAVAVNGKCGEEQIGDESDCCYKTAGADIIGLIR